MNRNQTFKRNVNEIELRLFLVVFMSVFQKCFDRAQEFQIASG